MYDYKNKVIVITGGASGMGRSFVSHILARGGLVSFGDINTHLSKSILMQVHTNAPKLVSRLLFTKTDIRDPAQIKELLDRTKSVYGRIDCLLCVAGVNVPDSFLEQQRRPDTADLSNLQVNLCGTINTVYAALPHLSDDARIVVIASTAGIYPSAAQPLYSASKHGLIGFSRSLAPLLQGQRIIVLAPSTYLPPHAVKDGQRVTPEAEEDVFTKIVGETVGFVKMASILATLDQSLEHAENGDVIEMTPQNIRKVDFTAIPEPFQRLDAALQAQLCPLVKEEG